MPLRSLNLLMLWKISSEESAVIDAPSSSRPDGRSHGESTTCCDVNLDAGSFLSEHRMSDIASSEMLASSSGSNISGFLHVSASSLNGILPHNMQ
mmetsp:Transcript_97758/g.271995  ORF Transcript_97758/g.271995 Transcript_97758/m.271995 type:complete len:95 (-) Transcript_97758:28-312(-)